MEKKGKKGERGKRDRGRERERERETENKEFLMVQSGIGIEARGVNKRE